MVERVGKTANEISDDPDCTRIKPEWTTYRFHHRMGHWAVLDGLSSDP